MSPMLGFCVKNYGNMAPVTVKVVACKYFCFNYSPFCSVHVGVSGASTLSLCSLGKFAIAFSRSGKRTSRSV